MDSARFTKLSDMALRLTNALISEFSLESFGLDSITVFNCILKELVIQNEEDNDDNHRD